MLTDANQIERIPMVGCRARSEQEQRFGRKDHTTLLSAVVGNSTWKRHASIELT